MIYNASVYSAAIEMLPRLWGGLPSILCQQLAAKWSSRKDMICNQRDFVEIANIDKKCYDKNSVHCFLSGKASVTPFMNDIFLLSVSTALIVHHRIREELVIIYFLISGLALEGHIKCNILLIYSIRISLGSSLKGSVPSDISSTMSILR